MSHNLSRRSEAGDYLYSLAFFRIGFGLLMVFALTRFLYKGWVTEFYDRPLYFFSYYGFEWASPPPEPYLHLLFYLLLTLAGLIAIGLFYRFAIISFFLLFTYAELWDKSVYLNHYYLISLLSFLMAFLPMNAVASFDRALFPAHSFREPFAFRSADLLKIQVGTVYFFGGIAKLNPDWLLAAQPLKIWLSAHQHVPLAGPLLASPATAYAAAWAALFFDLSAPFLLAFRHTRPWIYMAVVIFHVLTFLLFPIGIFPWIMMFGALIFFPSSWHKRIITKLPPGKKEAPLPQRAEAPGWVGRIILPVFFLLQLLMPFRHFLYPGNVMWHEQGFRFAWKIMLMEKNGTVEYHVTVKHTNEKFIVRPEEFLTPRQVTQMSFQPDMILQFAHFLHRHYLETGIGETEIRAESYAAVNGKGSRLLIDPEVDLAQEKEGFRPKPWITKGL